MNFMTFDHIIVGAGIVGAWCFHQLSDQGRVLLLERARAGSGVTGMSGGIVRVCHDLPERTCAAAEGLEAYRRLIHDSHDMIRFVQSGYLHFSDSVLLAGIAATVTDYGYEARLLDKQDIARFNGLDIRAEAAIYEPGSGYFDGHEVLNALISSGVRQGGTFIDGLSFLRIEECNGKVVGLSTGNGRFAAESVTLCLGVEMPDFLARHGWDDLGLWNQLIEVVRFTGQRPLPAAPSFYDDFFDINGRHCPVTGGLYVGHTTHVRTSAGTRRLDLRKDHALKVVELGRRRFGFLDAARASGGLCHVDCYSYKPLGYVGPIPDAPVGTFAVTGFSGGGYKIAPNAARRLMNCLS